MDFQGWRGGWPWQLMGPSQAGPSRAFRWAPSGPRDVAGMGGVGGVVVWNGWVECCSWRRKIIGAGTLVGQLCMSVRNDDLVVLV